MFVGHDELGVRQNLVFPINVQERANGAAVFSKIGKLNPVHFAVSLRLQLCHSNLTSKCRKSKGDEVPINGTRPGMKPRIHDS